MFQNNIKKYQYDDCTFADIFTNEITRRTRGDEPAKECIHASQSASSNIVKVASMFAFDATRWTPLP